MMNMWAEGLTIHGHCQTPEGKGPPRTQTLARFGKNRFDQANGLSGGHSVGEGWARMDTGEWGSRATPAN